MLEDQGAAHILAKDKKLLQTRFQRVTKGVLEEAKRRTLKGVIDAVQDDVEGGVTGLLDGDESPGDESSPTAKKLQEERVQGARNI